MNFVPTIDHTLDKCYTEPKRYIKPYIPRRVLEDIDTQVSVSVPAQHDLELPKLSSTERFVSKKDIRNKCRQLGVHSKMERFVPPPTGETWVVYAAVLLLAGYILKY